MSNESAARRWSVLAGAGFVIMVAWYTMLIGSLIYLRVQSPAGTQVRADEFYSRQSSDIFFVSFLFTVFFSYVIGGLVSIVAWAKLDAFTTHARGRRMAIIATLLSLSAPLWIVVSQFLARL